MGTDKPVNGQAGAGVIDVEQRRLHADRTRPGGQPRPQPNYLIDRAQPRRHRHRQLDALLLERGDRRADRRLGPLELVLRTAATPSAARSTRSARPGAAAPGRAPARTPAPRPPSTPPRSTPRGHRHARRADPGRRRIPADDRDAGPAPAHPGADPRRAARRSRRRSDDPQPRQLGPQAAPVDSSTSPLGASGASRSPRALSSRRHGRRRPVVIEHPNRRKASSQLARLVVIVLLIVSAAVVLIVTHRRLGHARGRQAASRSRSSSIYFVFALFVARWSRGVLPMIAGLAIILGHLRRGRRARLVRPRQGRVHRPGAQRRRARPAVRAARRRCRSRCCVVAMIAFRQQWNVEAERPRDGAARARRRLRCAPPCPGGGTADSEALKNLCPYGRAGSNPALGTASLERHLAAALAARARRSCRRPCWTC